MFEKPMICLLFTQAINMILSLLKKSIKICLSRAPCSSIILVKILQEKSMEGIDKAKLIIEINDQCNRKWGGLRHGNLSIYLDKVVEAHIEKGLDVAVIAILGIHPRRKDEIEKVLKEKKFKIITEVKIYFLDGGELVCRYVPKS
jgi:hypothetical protein